jgi:hypothetical protein
MSIYQPTGTRRIIIDHALSRVNDSVIINGVDQSLEIAKGVFFLEYVIPASGTTVTLKDGDGAEIVQNISALDSAFSPIRCDHGISIIGNTMIAKGYIVRNVFEE